MLLQLLSLVFSMHDNAMRPYGWRMAEDSTGHRVRYYELRQTNADWNLLFVHGTPGSSSAFVEQFRHPFPHANIFAMDRPGFGGSGPSKRHPSLDDQVEAVEAVLVHLPPLKTLLIGHSYGGPVVLAAALKYPHQVAGALLIGGSVDPAQERVLTVQRIGNLPLVEWLVPHALRQCNRELLDLRGDLVKLRAEIPELCVPVLMLHGTVDQQVPVANVDYLRTELAAAGKSNLFNAIVIPGINHFIPWQHPDLVEKALNELTRKVELEESAQKSDLVHRQKTTEGEVLH